MVKMVALYRKPENPAEFDQKYFEEHLPLARQMPGLQRVEVAKITGAPGGGESEYYMIAELYYNDMDSLNASVASPESRAAGKVLMSFAKGLVSFHVAEVR